MATRNSLILNSGFIQELNTSADKLNLAGNSTSDLSEGTNLYYTDARTRGAISLSTVSPSPNTGLGSLTYSSSTGAFSFTQVTDADVRGLLSATTATGVTYASSTGVIALANIPNSSLTNSSITFTDALGDSTAVSLGGSYSITHARKIAGNVRNETGAQLDNGTPVCIVGISGSIPLVDKADANDASKMPCIGLLVEDVADQSTGAMVFTGVANGYDTSSFSVGDVVYISTTPGELVTSPPTGETSQIQNIGKVLKSAANGRILVMGPGRSNAVSNLDDGNVFIGNASNQATTATLDTDLVPEGTAQYFTNTRARSAISVTDSGGDGSLGYNSSTGVITYTGPSASEVRAHLSAASGSGLTYNSSTGEFGTSAIPNSQLANSTVTVGSTSIALGSSATTITGLTSVTSAAVVTNDSGFRVRDNSDNTKQLAFECSGISTSTTRTMTVPNSSGIIATEDFATAIAVALG